MLPKPSTQTFCGSKNFTKLMVVALELGSFLKEESSNKKGIFPTRKKVVA